jgi:methionyl-tRNA formyltransferase
MKIVFIGTLEFSYKILEKLIDLNANIVGVCTKEKSNFNTDYTDLTSICKKNNISYQYMNDINTKENIKWIKSKNPDIIFCFGWSSLIKKELLNLPQMGVVGYHPTKLPQNRGRHPLTWALDLGLEKSASTFFFMDEGADSGDILSQVDFEIYYQDDVKSLYDKVTNIALKQIEDFLPKLENNTYNRIKQEHSKASYWRKRTKRDEKIDFRMSSRAIYNLVRSLTKPYIGSYLVYKEKEIKIWKVEEVDYNQKNIEPGKILEVKNNKILVKCFDNAIRILEHDFDEIPKVGEYL